MFGIFGPELIPQIVNLIIAFANIFWSLQLKGIQSSRAMIDSLKDANREKDKVIRELMDKKNQYKMQYHSLHTKYQKLEGELTTYKRIHNK